MEKLMAYCKTCKVGLFEDWSFRAKQVESKAQTHVNQNQEHYVQVLIIDDSYRVFPNKEDNSDGT